MAVSPIVTVEPRRRKFHKPITLTIPLPQAATRGMINQYNGDAPTLRLLCSITGGQTKAQWEDVTGSTPLTFLNDCVSFTTTVSARFWLMDCRQVNEATKYATDVYREAIHVPFMAKFVVFAKRIEPMEANLRVFCMTDDKEEKTLEHQEHFSEIAKSRDVEVLEKKDQYIEFAGNLIPVMKSGDELTLSFSAFLENRLSFPVRLRDAHQEPIGRIAFMKEPRKGRSDPSTLTPICNLNLQLPNILEMPPDEMELRHSPFQKDQKESEGGFDILREELGSRGTSADRDLLRNSDLNLMEERDIMKVCISVVMMYSSLTEVVKQKQDPESMEEEMDTTPRGSHASPPKGMLESPEDAMISPDTSNAESRAAAVQKLLDFLEEEDKEDSHERASMRGETMSSPVNRDLYVVTEEMPVPPGTNLPDEPHNDYEDDADVDDRKMIPDHLFSDIFVIVLSPSLLGSRLPSFWFSFFLPFFVVNSCYNFC